MFTYTLDVLLFFAVTTPVMGLLAHRIKQKRFVEYYASLGFVVALLFLPLIYSEVSANKIVVITLGFTSSFPIGVYLGIDSLSVFMITIYIAIGLITTLYSIRYMKHDTGLPSYFTLLLGITAGMIGVVISGDLFTLFIFWEIMCICSYALVAFRKENWEPVEAGFKYLIMSGAGGLTLLFGISILYGSTGTLNLALLSEALAGSVNEQWIYLALTLLIAGFGLQAGMSPLHTWLPDAHSASPAPVSAILSGTMVMTGIYGIFRILILIFNPLQGVWRITLAVFSIATMFTGNLMALLQDDVKRLLAFSTIANVGYILLGLTTKNLAGLTGSLFQILNHAIVKALLFLCAGSFIFQTNTRNLKELNGIVHKMPITSALFILGILALAGIPPLNIFWSEWTILIAGIESGMLVFTALMVVNLVLTIAYCLRIIQTILFMNMSQKSMEAVEAPLSILLPIFMLGILCVVIGIYPGPFRSMAEEAAQAALNIEVYLKAILASV